MDSIFLSRLLITFFTGVAWIFLSISTGNRSGSNISGFIAGLPSTALLAFFFIGLTQGPDIASTATIVFPLSYSMTGVFLLIYAITIKRGLYVAISAGLIIWFTGALLISILRPSNYIFNICIYLLILPVLYSMLKRVTGKDHCDSKSLPLSYRLIFYRSLLGGGVITLAVLFSKLGGPLFGGIFSAFPAMFISTLIIAHKTYGEEFSRKMTRPLLVTGMITIVVFSVGVRYLYPEFGLIYGTFLSIILSALSAVLTLILIRKAII